MATATKDAISDAEHAAGEEVQAVKELAGKADKPVARADGSYVLPAGLKKLDLSGVTLKRNDTGCRACGGALFGRLDVVRMPVGYASGQRKGELLWCLACGEVLNVQEIAEW